MGHLSLGMQRSRPGGPQILCLVSLLSAQHPGLLCLLVLVLESVKTLLPGIKQNTPFQSGPWVSFPVKSKLV